MRRSASATLFGTGGLPSGSRGPRFQCPFDPRDPAARNASANVAQGKVLWAASSSATASFSASSLQTAAHCSCLSTGDPRGCAAPAALALSEDSRIYLPLSHARLKHPITSSARRFARHLRWSCRSGHGSTALPVPLPAGAVRLLPGAWLERPSGH